MEGFRLWIFVRAKSKATVIESISKEENRALIHLQEPELFLGYRRGGEAFFLRLSVGSSAAGRPKLVGNKSNAQDIIKWHWQPKTDDLPPFDPVQLLEHFRNTNIGFVGDSLNRNMFISMVCTLKRASNDVKKWRPAGADRGFTFIQYNVTVAYHRTNFLARCGRWVASANGETSWAKAPIFHDILIFNTGHWWWAPSKFDPIKSPMLFFEKVLPVIPPINPEDGLNMVLKHMISFVERKPSHGIKFFHTQSPRHFEGGDWDQGGSCHRVQPLLPEQQA
ncbi:hypothetical protein NE237_010461 [Protea cynaroides]|uniref:Trichome birefringence-like C-terminal domain-containing protein n=1 Tax=Protea cynaroides TaxID=273540 RepID=A0A9Q0L0A6_9MAGN|nr:hypothetical protein NE237_010461 [Protea cynaroides]